MAGDYASEKKISLLTVMEKKQKKIHALMQGQTIPFNALLVIRVWDKTRDGLNAKAGAIKNAINSMNAAQYFESNLPSTSNKSPARPRASAAWNTPSDNCSRACAIRSPIMSAVQCEFATIGSVTAAE